MKTIDLTWEDLLLCKKGDLFCLSNLRLQFTLNVTQLVDGFELSRPGATWKIKFTRQ